MEITEVRVRVRNDTDKKLKAYATMTFDHEFVVRDVKVIEGKKRALRGYAQPKVTGKLSGMPVWQRD